MSQIEQFAYNLRPTNRDLSHIDGDFGLPLVGKTFAMFRDPEKTFAAHYRKYGPVSRFGMIGNKCVLLAHPDYAQTVMLDRDKSFSAKMGWMDTMGEFFEGSLVLRDFDDHRIHRGIMQTAFKPDAMRSHAEKIRVIVETKTRQWAKKGDVLFYNEVKRLLLEIALEVFCGGGQSEEERDAINQAFIDMMDGTLGIVRKDWPGFLYHRGLQGRRRLWRHFFGLIDQKRASEDDDVFAHFCRSKQEDGTYYSHEDIAHHMVFLMLAAHDTTTSAITMAGYYFANNMAIQEEVAAEANEESRPLSYDSIFRSMKKMVCVFYETLRLHPPVMLFMRRTVRQCNFDDVRVPADTMVCVPPCHIHRLEDWWESPNEFNPARFSDEVGEHRKHNFMWIPFGGGAHKCIGMHFARLLFVSTFAELFRGHRLEYKKENYFPTKLQHFPFSRPTDNLPMKVVARSSAMG